MAVKFRFKVNNKGGVLVEFAMCATLFLMVFLTTIEWTLEVFARHATERGLAAATQVYSETRDRNKAFLEAKNQGMWVTAHCLKPIEIRHFNSILGEDLTDPNVGYDPRDNPSDNNAVFAMVTLHCEWKRFSPFIQPVLGRSMHYEVTSLTVLR